MEKIDRAVFLAEQYYHTLALGGWAHAALCSKRLATQADRSWAAFDPAAKGKDAFVNNVHAFGMRGAQAFRMAFLPVDFVLHVVVGTGRMRSLPERGDLDTEPLPHLRALLNHPLDTGLLGLQSAYFMGKHALIAGSVGCGAGAVLGTVAYLPLGYRSGQRFDLFVSNAMRQCAIVSACIGAVAGSCLIMAPHNLLLMQLTRLATAMPALLENMAGYAMGAAVGLAYLAAVHLGAAMFGVGPCTRSAMAAHSRAWGTR